MSLRSKAIHLAHSNAALRPALLPLLAKTSAAQDLPIEDHSGLLALLQAKGFIERRILEWTPLTFEGRHFEVLHLDTSKPNTTTIRLRGQDDAYQWSPKRRKWRLSRAPAPTPPAVRERELDAEQEAWYQLSDEETLADVQAFPKSLLRHSILYLDLLGPQTRSWLEAQGYVEPPPRRT